MGWIFLLLLPAVAFGAEVDFSQSDFIHRTINFAIFVAILWYLLANPLKNALKNRQSGIADKLNAIQDKLAASNASKAEALKSLEQSKKRAQDIVSNAKKEAAILVAEIEKQYNSEIENLNKNHQELLKFEQRKMKRSVVDEVLRELLKDGIELSKDDYINILTKRVA